MKYNSLLKLFILLLTTSSLHADLYSKNYYSIHPGGFRNQTGYNKANIDGTEYFYLQTEINGLSYLKNARIFIPNLTSSFLINGLRKGSAGWVTVAYSLGGLSALYDSQQNLLSSYKGKYVMTANSIPSSSNIVTNSFQLPSYDNGNKLTQGITLASFNDFSLYLNADFEKNNNTLDLNKWLYIAFDDRPDPTAQNALSTFRFSFISYLKAESVKNYVENKMDKNTYASYKSQCTNDKLLNLCIYLKSFGSDGSSSDLSSHSLTAANFDQIYGDSNTPKKDITIPQNWSIIGTQSNDIYLDYAKWDPKPQLAYTYNQSNGWYAYKNNTITSQTVSKLIPGQGMWVYTDTPTTLEIADTPTELTTISLKSGWNLLSAPKDTSTKSISTQDCVQAIYRYSNGSWTKWDRHIVNNTPAGQTPSFQDFSININEGFWVKTNKTCTITY